jgi:hypothetical protein
MTDPRLIETPYFLKTKNPPALKTKAYGIE